jgi:hypothetical protein
VSKIILQRLKLANDRRTAEYTQPNSSIAATFQSIDPQTGLIEVQTADGGVQLQRKIYKSILAVGDAIPAPVTTSGYGFADGKGV